MLQNMRWKIREDHFLRKKIRNKNLAHYDRTGRPQKVFRPPLAHKIKCFGSREQCPLKGFVLAGLQPNTF